MSTVLGIDLGTQSLKVVFYDYDKREITASASSPLQVDRDDAGKAEQNAKWWLTALADALHRVPTEVRKSTQGVSVSGQQHGFVPLDEEGKVLAPVKLWCDTSTQQQVEEITHACGGRDACIARTGNPVLAGYTAPKIRWLAQNCPERYARLSHIALPHDYLNFVLTGTLRMESGDASGTGLFNVRTKSWSKDMLAAVDSDRDLSACLPPLIAANSVLGNITRSSSEKFGLPEGIPVAAGGGDNMMAAIGTGNVVPGRLTISLGTSGTLFAFAKTPVVDPEGNIAAFCSSTGGWLPLLCTMNCTFATEQMRSLLGLDADQFDDVTRAVPAGSDGLAALPFFNGERTPDLPYAKATLLGMSAHNMTPGHFMRAAAEGATFGLRFGLDQLEKLGLRGQSIVVTGGGSKSTVWRQMLADVCSLPVVPLMQDEGAGFGAALHALWMLESQKTASASIAEITSEHVVENAEAACIPDNAVARTYHSAYAEYRRAVQHMSSFYSA